MASLRDSLSRGCPASDASFLAWPAAGLPKDSEETLAFRHLMPTAIRRVPPPHDGSSSRTDRGCCTSTGRDSHRFGPTLRDPVVSDDAAGLPAVPDARFHPSKKLCSRASQPLPVNRCGSAREPTRATRCACPLDVSTSSRRCSAMRSQPPVPRFRSRSGVDSFHGFLCSPLSVPKNEAASLTSKSGTDFRRSSAGAEARLLSRSSPACLQRRAGCRDETMRLPCQLWHTNERGFLGEFQGIRLPMRP